MVASTVAVELQEQLLFWERQLDSREGTIITWEDGLAAFECILGRVHIEHDARRIQAEATQ
jgi:hypothetical protein